MGIKDVYYKYTDGDYRKRAKEAVKELEGFMKKHRDFFMTQDKIATTISIGIACISQISNLPTINHISYEASEVDRVLSGASSLLIDKAKKGIKKNNVAIGTTAVSLMASALFLPLALKSIPATFFASKRIKKRGRDIYEECNMAIEENNARICSINSRYGGVKEWRKLVMGYVDEAEKMYKEVVNNPKDYNGWDNEQKRTFSDYISAVNKIGDAEYKIL